MGIDLIKEKERIQIFKSFDNKKFEDVLNWWVGQMKEFNIGNERYLTICSVHERIHDMFLKLNKLNPDNFKTKEDLLNEIKKITENSLKLIYVAKEMGQNMENGLNAKRELTHYYSYPIIPPDSIFYEREDD